MSPLILSGAIFNAKTYEKGERDGNGKVEIRTVFV